MANHSLGDAPIEPQYIEGQPEVKGRA